MPLTVCCIKWGDKYPPTYVNRLEQAVHKHLSVPHTFLCLTDNPEGVNCETRPLLTNHGLTGWWHKVSLFDRQPFGIEGRFLFLDLDVAILSSLDPMVECPVPLAITRDWNGRTYNSAAFSMEVGAFPQVWEQFSLRAVERLFGDQDWMTKQIPESQVHYWPAPWIASYKRHARAAAPLDARVVCFHGRPKPHEIKYGWVQRYWNGN